MSLNKEKLKFEAKTQRVKNICFHPSKPWVIITMRSGLIQLWDYNLKISLAKFQQHDGGVRGVDFHPQLPLFVSGGDDSHVKVWDYKQKRCLFTLKGHIDYIRTTFFHNQLPWILSACDDQTMRIWNYQSRACVNIITGHSHYVMCAQFHQQKNLIVSASLDSTVRIWDYTILKKKLTQSKNLSSFIGIEIECIKVLQGHERGANWVCFHPTQNLIASASDDRRIKLWKYTNEVAWQHSTLPGHKNNVSCVIFDKKTGFLISNSEDRTTKIWNIQTKAEVAVHKRQGDRYWIANQSKNGNLIGIGHDSGFQIFEINKERVPHGMIDENLVVFAQGMKAFMYDALKKNQKQELYQHVPKQATNSFYIEKIIVNQVEPSHFIVQINEEGRKIFTIKKKQSYLNFPIVIGTFDGLDACFVSKSSVAVLHSPSQILLMDTNMSENNIKGKRLKFKQQVIVKNIFSGPEQNIIVVVSETQISQYDTSNNYKLLAFLQIQSTEVNSLVYGFNKIAIICTNSIIITNFKLQHIVTITQKFPVKSAFWNNQDLLIFTTTNHWKYSLMNGETGLLKTLEKPIHLLKKISDTKFLAFNDEQKIFEIEFPSCIQIDFKRAVLQKDWNKTKSIIKQAVQQNKKYLVSYLVEKGLASIALDMVQNPQQKFSLAIQATNFQLAFEICNKINTPQYWQLLGDEALKQGIYEAYELANQKLKNFDKLNFLYSLQANTQKLQKMQKFVTKMNNPMLGFNVALFMNKHEEMQKILRDCGFDQLAALTQQARQDPSEHSDLLKRLGSRRLQICQPEGEADFSNWPLNVLEAEEQAA